MPDPNDDFLRRFAVEIAAALREKEDGTTRSTATATTTTTRPFSSSRNPLPGPGLDESVEDFYRALVFDEPLVDHIPNLSVVAPALARQLASHQKRFALSNRLVNGIVYLCNQKNATTTTSPPPPLPSATNHQTGSGGNGNDGSGLGPTDGPSHSAIQIAMAKLAFSVLVEIPLECCRDDSTSERSLTKIRALLGSYKGTPNPSTKRSEFESESESEFESDATTTTGEGVPKNDGVRDDEEEEEKETAENDNDNGIGGASAAPQYADEVWAAESDPSDYDYGEGDNDFDADADADPWRQQQQSDGSDWLDPSVLSQPDPKSTLQQTRDAVGSLLRLASYTLLRPIFGLPPKETARYLSRLHQLTLVLLRPWKPQPIGDDDGDGDGDASFFLHSSMDHAVLSPLWILRDAASYHNKSNKTNTVRKSSATAPDYEQTYLQVLQTLLGTDQAYLQDLAAATHGSDRLPSLSSSTGVDLCVPSIVGLSALSSWCASQQPRPTRATIDALVDSMNDLDHVVQRSRDRESRGSNRNLRQVLVPVLEVLSGIAYDGGGNHNDRDRRHDPSAAARYGGSTIPQTLLNSGFLRQILALAVAAPNANANANTNANTGTDANNPNHVSPGFEHALWGLCVAYPKIVGKYVFRYPGSSELVRSSGARAGLETNEDDPSDCVQRILWNAYGWHQCAESSSGGGGGLTLLRKPGSRSKAAGLPPKKLTPDECREVCAEAWRRLCWLVRNAVAPREADDNDSDNDNDEAGAERVIREWGRLLALAKIPSVSPHVKSLVDASLLDDVAAAIADASRRSRPAAASSAGDSGEGKDDKEKEKDDKPSRKQKIVSRAHKLLKEYRLFFRGTTVGTSKTD